MKIKYFDRNANKHITVYLHDAVDLVEIQVDGESRLGPYHNINLNVQVNTQGVSVLSSQETLATIDFNDTLQLAQINGVQIPMRQLQNLSGDTN